MSSSQLTFVCIRGVRIPPTRYVIICTCSWVKSMENQWTSAAFLLWISVLARVWQWCGKGGIRSPFIIPTTGREFFLIQKCRSKKEMSKHVVAFTGLNCDPRFLDIIFCVVIYMFFVLCQLILAYLFWVLYILMHDIPMTKAWGLGQRHALRAAAARGAPGTLRGGMRAPQCSAGRPPFWKVHICPYVFYMFHLGEVKHGKTHVEILNISCESLFFLDLERDSPYFNSAARLIWNFTWAL